MSSFPSAEEVRWLSGSASWGSSWKHLPGKVRKEVWNHFFMGHFEKGQHALLNEGEENEMEIFGYRTQGCRKSLCLAGSIFSFGILPLVFYWRPAWHVWAHCVPCSLQEADTVLLRTTDEFQIYSWKKVIWIYLSALNSAFGLTPDHPVITDEEYIINRAIRKPDLKVRCIKVQKIRYVWNYLEGQFQKIGSLEDWLSSAKIHQKFGSGLTREEQEIRRLICGPNTIDVEVTPIWKLLIKEQSVKLHHLVESHNSITVSVCGRKAGVQELESHVLVPGDLLILTGNKVLMPCDAVLIEGSCVVDEGMLTGESIPVTKTPLPKMDSSVPWKTQSEADYKRHVLFCGTEVIQAKAACSGTVRAVVLQTGFNTAKGDLVRSILYPKPMNFKLYRDAIRFLLCLVGTATVGMIYTLCVYVLSGEPPEEVMRKALDVITIAVPPALPAALTTGIIYAQRRLKKSGIFCISPQRINVCGQLNLVCFDKTGTLTRDGLDLWGVVSCDRNGFQEVHSFASGQAVPWGPLCAAMASCHSLILLDGTIQGDPLDLKMFEATTWEMAFSGDDFSIKGVPAHATVVKPCRTASQVPVEGIAILHQFPFSSALQRMTVIVQEMGGDRLAFMKGAPERVASFCQPETVPTSFVSELQIYTTQGFRVIALAYKKLENDHHTTALTRETVESDLIFLGLLILENRLKEETKPVLEELISAQIRTVMITGDNLQTAITVARKSGMVSENQKVILIEANETNGSSSASISWTLVEEKTHITYGNQDNYINIRDEVSDNGREGSYHFALTGKSFHVISQHFSSLLPKILINGTIFARMSPGQKSSLVEEFQKLDYFVGMCGDGANDCGALKMAHVGISLSEQEASVASPFTSKTPNIECVPHLIKEGRAALVTSFCMFKYMALYSMIQYVGVLLLYWETNSLSNYQFLFQDLAITTLIGVTMNLNGAYPKLVPFRPAGRLISPPLLLSVIFNILLSLAMHIAGFILVQRQPWYSVEIHSACTVQNESISDLTMSPAAPEKMESNSAFTSFENTTIWFLGTINCIIVALVFSKGKPFRQPTYTNYVFVLVLIIQLGVCLFILFADIPELYRRLDLLCTPILWRVSIVIMLSLNFIVSLVAEEAVIENRALWMMIKRCFGYQSKSQYRIWQRDLAGDPSWPPLNQTSHSDMPECGRGVSYSNPVFESNEEQL
ncbi:probable cation-transporting ATPase 13A4 isoform X3 [Macaca thibetana thibetana]|uniref:probable cation-transporting ATPase 13A4 isoform X3 n=1 Tax=Macaca thibetana thibetana TaxID=257877 RepID=UPI0021BC3AE0|nr:probable cation-transporting ATPase 13A4 isoform X3 [Macaca thibetana thibetana]